MEVRERVKAPTWQVLGSKPLLITHSAVSCQWWGKEGRRFLSCPLKGAGFSCGPGISKKC